MTKRKSSGGGSTFFGMLVGLIIGLAVAAGVAYYVVKAPTPFMDKASRSPDGPNSPDSRQAQDPNAALGNRDTGPVTAPSAPDQPVGQTSLGGTEAPVGSTSAAKPGGDALGSLIASLTPTNPTARAPQTTPSARTETALPGASSSTSSPVKATGPYYLQVGSFRVLEDAEALRAKIILMGLQVEIQRAEVNGLQVNRVRVGPFAGIDEMNKTRIKLGQEKIPTAVVRQ